MVTTGGGHHSPPDDILQIVKRGSNIINRPDLADPQYWGTYSAAQVRTCSAETPAATKST